MSSQLADRDYKADVERAWEIKKDYVDDLLKQYEVRRAKRLKSKIPVLAFCGHGRAGKDLGAEWLGQNYKVTYGGSLSEIIAPLIAVVLDKPVDVCFKDRHLDREYWYHFCSTLRTNDASLLAKMLLAKADVVVGMRGAIELETCIANDIVDLAVWIDNPRVQLDPTLEYSETSCHITVLNDGTKLEYFNRLRRLATAMRLPVRSKK